MKKSFVFCLFIFIVLLSACSSNTNGAQAPDPNDENAVEDSELPEKAREAVSSIEAAYKRCVEEKDPSEILAINELIFLAENDPEVAPYLNLDALKNLAVKCATFKISFRSLLEPLWLYDAKGSKTVSPTDASVTSKVQYKAEIPLQITVSGEFPQCDVHRGFNEAFLNIDLVLDLTVPASPGKIELKYSTNHPGENYTGDNCSESEEFVFYSWDELFCQFRQADGQVNIATDCSPSGDGSQPPDYEVKVPTEHWEIGEMGNGEWAFSMRTGSLDPITYIGLEHDPQ